MADGQEIERKWLITEAPPAEILAGTGERIEQGYLTIGAGGAETRVRSRAGDHILGVKSGTGLIRREQSVLLTTEQFQALWPLTEGARVEKTRYLAPTATPGITIELDIYTGALAGLLIAEVEFTDAQAAAAFAAPDWFGPEVTEDPAYKNQRLAVHGRP